METIATMYNYMQKHIKFAYRENHSIAKKLGEQKGINPNIKDLATECLTQAMEFW